MASQAAPLRPLLELVSIHVIHAGHHEPLRDKALTLLSTQLSKFTYPKPKDKRSYFQCCSESILPATSARPLPFALCTVEGSAYLMTIRKQITWHAGPGKHDCT